jgi:nicotinic acid mononucleotide adenylyltransferase
MVEGRFIVKLRNTDDSVDKREILERISRVNSDLENDKLHTRMDVHLITEAVSSVSSTAARNTSDEEKLSMHLDQSIINYIKVNKLYKFSSN